MEYERASQTEKNNFGLEKAMQSESVRRADTEPRDVPPPIVYDDEFGKTVLAFSKIGTVNGYKAYDISYKHNNQEPYSLSNFLGQDFFFWWTNRTPFFTLASDGTPMVSVNYNALASSRNHILSLGHEIGHTHQFDVDRDLWRVLGTNSNQDLIDDLKDKYPTLSSHIDDLDLTRRMSQTSDIKKLQEFARQLTHAPERGFMTGIDTKLPLVADQMVRLERKTVPVGPTHYGDFFIPNHLQHTLPGIYIILDSMGEQKAWEFAMQLEEEGLIEPGFHTDEERLDLMRRGLLTYDRKYKTTAYTDWLYK